MHRYLCKYIYNANYSLGCKVKGSRKTTASARSNSRLCTRNGMEGKEGPCRCVGYLQWVFYGGNLEWQSCCSQGFQYFHTLVFSCNVFLSIYMCCFAGQKRWGFVLENEIQLHVMDAVLCLKSKWFRGGTSKIISSHRLSTIGPCVWNKNICPSIGIRFTE